MTEQAEKDAPWGEDDEEFCPDCFAGMESSEHHEKCVIPTTGDTLAEFLLQRIAEDEAAVEGFWSGDGDPDFMWGPGRIRVECEAKRRIILNAVDPGDDLWLRLLATPFRDHPDYDPAWGMS